MSRKPRLILASDDHKSQMSELHATVHKKLNRIVMEHKRQDGWTEIIDLFPDQIDCLADYLKQCKRWINSGYLENLKPVSFNEYKNL